MARFFYLDYRMVTIEDTIFAKWDEWLSVIHKDIEWLLTNYYIYKEVKEIVKNNRDIQENNTIFAWMSMVCLDSVAIGIRRQIDKTNGSISLANLLKDIKNKPKVICRKRFVALYEPMPEIHPGIKLDFGNKDFNSFAGEGEEYIDEKMIDSDLKMLEENGKKIKKFVNKRIAHRDKAHFEYVPDHDEIQDCLDYLEALLKKYLLLFRAQSWDPIIPIFQFDWLKVLREPWIKE